MRRTCTLFLESVRSLPVDLGIQWSEMGNRCSLAAGPIGELLPHTLQVEAKFQPAADVKPARKERAQLLAPLLLARQSFAP